MRHQMQPLCRRRRRAWPGHHCSQSGNMIHSSSSSLQLPTTVQCIQTPLDRPHNALLVADAVTSPILPAMWHASLSYRCAINHSFQMPGQS